MNAGNSQVQKHMVVFSTFCRIHTALALQIVDIEYPEDDFADVKTRMSNGNVVEWQLGRWVDQAQMGAIRLCSEYNPLTATEALRNILVKKASKYAGLQGTDARLLLHYEEAVLYNSPYHQSSVALEDMAYLAGHWLGVDFPRFSTAFREAYLLHCDERRVFQIFPSVLCV
ncbi:MAG TPA: hypothetical protein VJ746_06710 [Nitrospira sp.]|nr:hypothetical protein [Nitrospira sp.]